MKRWIVFVTLAIIAIMPLDLLAQGCAVCTKTASELGENGARGLNAGIIYLALLPLGILGTVGFFWWRGSKVRG